MPKAWRITKKKFAAKALDGEGARSHGGRWSSPGTRIVYTAGSQSLAILEILVHLQQPEFLSHYVVLEVDFPDELVDKVDPRVLPLNWRTSPAPHATLAIGDDWIKRSSSAILRVPSVIVPSEYNFLINPAHSDFKRITIGQPNALDLDPRLLKK